MVCYRLFALAVLSLIALSTVQSKAEDIVASWDTVKLPAAPPLKAVKLDPRRTALLLLDFDVKNCNPEKRVRCSESLPAVAALLADARSRGLLVVYSTVATGSMQDVPPVLAAKPGERFVRAGVDKFFHTDLADLLKARNIHSVIVTGTSAHGAVFYTASAAALRGLQTVVPVDGMSADDPFAELSAAWILVNAPASVSTNVIVTRSNLIRYSSNQERRRNPRCGGFYGASSSPRPWC
jgi:nicotinamidase-related amidase